jgi:hypothetical protein
MTKEDFVNEIFMNGINISLFALPFKDLLINIGVNEEKRQAAIRHLKDLCSDTNYLLNGLRSDEDFKKYSKDYDEAHRRWLEFLKDNGLDTQEKLDEYKEIVRKFINLLEK